MVTIPSVLLGVCVYTAIPFFGFTDGIVPTSVEEVKPGIVARISQFGWETMNTDIVELVHRARWFPVIEHSIHKWVNSNDTCGLGKIRVYAQPNTDLVVSTCSNNPLLTDTASRERLKLKIAEIEGKLDIQDSIESKLARLDQRIDAADAQAKQQQEKSQEKEISRERSIEQGFGIGH